MGVEIGYKTMKCVGDGTIYGLTKDRLFWAFIGLIIGMGIMILFIKYKEMQFAKGEKED